MPGRGTAPGPELYRECGSMAGVRRHKRERTLKCAGCREASRVDMARYRVRKIVGGPRLVPTLGLTRRVHALARCGWSQADLAARIGVTEAAFNKIVHQAETRREVVEQVRALYAELAWRAGPNAQARRNAERRGWPGPLDWDDPDDPREVPACEIEKAHREALEMVRLKAKNEARRQAHRAEAAARRPALRVLAGGRQAGAVEPGRQHTALA